MAGALLPLVAGIAGAASRNSTQSLTNQRIQRNQQVTTSPEQAAQFQPKLERAADLIAYHPDRYALPYNSGEVRAINGTVQSVETYRFPGTSVRGVLLRVRANDGRTIWVQAGPQPFLESRDTYFHRGQTVLVTGSMARTGRHQETMVASRMWKRDQGVLVLRALDGRPLWNLDEYQGRAHAHGYGRYQNPHGYYGY
jgi:hypothetical protein